MAAFWGSLAVVFIAELGDKTQLVALCLASRYRAGIVLAGILVATLVVHIISVLLGGGLGQVLRPEWVALVAGLAFLGFGLWTLKGDELEDEESCGVPKKRIAPFWLVTTTFFIAELGDKTMLSTVTLATDHRDLAGLALVWIGSSLGMVISDGLAIVVGLLLGKKLPERAVKIGASVIFFGFGVWKLIEAGFPREQDAVAVPWFAWPIAAVVVAAMVVWFVIGILRDRRRTAGGPELAAREEELVAAGR